MYNKHIVVDGKVYVEAVRIAEMIRRCQEENLLNNAKDIGYLIDFFKELQKEEDEESFED